MSMRIKRFFFSIFFVVGLCSYPSMSHAMLSRLFWGIFGYGKPQKELKIQPPVENQSGNEKIFWTNIQDDGWEDYGAFFEQENAEEAKLFPKEEIRVGINNIKTNVLDYMGKKIAQLPVLNQFEINGGGGASCGYQTLKNGIVTILALLGRDVPNDVKRIALRNHQKEELSKNLETKLNDVGLTEQFFGNVCGIWRKQIVLGRFSDRLKPLLRGMWEQYVLDSKTVVDSTNCLNKKKVAQFYSMALGSLATIVAQEVVFEEKKFSFCQKDAYEKLLAICRETCRKKRPDDINSYFTTPAKTNTRHDLTEYLCKPERLNKYVDFKKLKNLEVSPANYLALIEEGEKFVVTTNRQGLGSRSFNGDWVDVKELEYLISYEQKNGMLKEVKNVSWLVYDDISLLEASSDVTINREKLIEAAKKTVINPNHIVVFCIGTMQNSRDEISGSWGHWFPLIWSKDRNYTMDSLGNKCRLTDDRVKKILDEFEKLRTFNMISQSTVEPFWGNKVTGPLLALQQAGVLKKRPFWGNKVTGPLLALQQAGVLSRVTH